MSLQKSEKLEPDDTRAMLAAEANDQFERIHNLSKNDVDLIFTGLQKFALKHCSTNEYEACTQLLNNLREGTRKYLQYFEKQFEFYGCFPEEKLKSLHHKATQFSAQELLGSDILSTKFSDLLFQKLSTCNSLIVQSRVVIATQSADQIISFFKAQTKLIQKLMYPYNESRYKLLSQELLQHCLREFANNIQITDQHLEQLAEIKSQSVILHQRLNQIADNNKESQEIEIEPKTDELKRKIICSPSMILPIVVICMMVGFAPSVHLLSYPNISPEISKIINQTIPFSEQLLRKMCIAQGPRLEQVKELLDANCESCSNLTTLDICMHVLRRSYLITIGVHRPALCAPGKYTDFMIDPGTGQEIIPTLMCPLTQIKKNQCKNSSSPTLNRPLQQTLNVEELDTPENEDAKVHAYFPFDLSICFVTYYTIINNC